jgi:hypothetical protein
VYALLNAETSSVPATLVQIFDVILSKLETFWNSIGLQSFAGVVVPLLTGLHDKLESQTNKKSSKDIIDTQYVVDAPMHQTITQMYIFFFVIGSGSSLFKRCWSHCSRK